MTGRPQTAGELLALPDAPADATEPLLTNHAGIRGDEPLFAWGEDRDGAQATPVYEAVLINGAWYRRQVIA